MEGSPHHVVALSGAAREHTRVLKQGDTFAVFDANGDIRRSGVGEEGLFHAGTRFLSWLRIELEGARPFLLSSTIRDENDQLTVDLTNPDLFHEGQTRVTMGTLHLGLRRFLWNGVLYQQLKLKNHGLELLSTSLTLHFTADYADIFEVRGLRRPARGRDLPAQVESDSVVLAYEGLDRVVRRTQLRFTPAPTELAGDVARFDVALQPQEEVRFQLSVACEQPPQRPSVTAFEQARAEAERDLQRFKAWSCHLETSNAEVNAWTNRAVSDLHMMTTELPSGPYPYAGVPWFNTPFGRDGIITALECLWMRPELARGVLAYLAATQATAEVPEQDAEPGKILHETRGGEMAALKEIPFERYYGSVDATPLFVMLAAAYYERTGDRAFVESLWPHVDAALEWIERYGDRDGDGFVEYSRQAERGLVHQGWKDSDDGVSHEDGTLAHGPIAICEVQGYVYAAWHAAAKLATLVGKSQRAEALARKGEQLRTRFDRAFWCDPLSSYALALDGDKRPCSVRASNAGQCLFTGIATPERASRLARSLLSPELFSGWGVRTLAASAARYNPMSYHNGTIWPHDNALIAYGLARYGMTDLALEIWNGQFAAGRHFDLHRVPELFCGFPQDPGIGPVLYPVACSPQAWSAGSVLLLFHAILGLSISSPEARVSFFRPRLPAAIDQLFIHNLRVAGATVDLHLARHEQDVGVNVLRREGDVEVIVVK
ncbi:MAG TPA: amylo-alpha-1,6-glucosidase [Candidatus Polarisedimenticolaceae bacterium]|nr:amylo-alpha-1,6-glucosidase [Candidatus Polarisedimenticolaceae bacterium]